MWQNTVLWLVPHCTEHGNKLEVTRSLPSLAEWGVATQTKIGLGGKVGSAPCYQLSPAVRICPMNTSETCPAPTPALCRASRITKLPSSWAGREDRPPFSVPMGVLTALMMYTSSFDPAIFQAREALPAQPSLTTHVHERRALPSLPIPRSV